MEAGFTYNVITLLIVLGEQTKVTKVYSRRNSKLRFSVFSFYLHCYNSVNILGEQTRVTKGH